MRQAICPLSSALFQEKRTTAKHTFLSGVALITPSLLVPVYDGCIDGAMISHLLHIPRLAFGQDSQDPSG